MLVNGCEIKSCSSYKMFCGYVFEDRDKKKNEHVVSEIDDELYLSYHDVIKVDNNRMDRQS